MWRQSSHDRPRRGMVRHRRGLLEQRRPLFTRPVERGLHLAQEEPRVVYFEPDARPQVFMHLIRPSRPDPVRVSDKGHYHIYGLDHIYGLAAKARWLRSGSLRRHGAGKVVREVARGDKTDRAA